MRQAGSLPYGRLGRSMAFPKEVGNHGLIATVTLDTQELPRAEQARTDRAI
jgi:hypothetical protein